MKKLSVLFMFVAFGMILTTSCGGDEEFADPTITFQNGTSSLEFTGANGVDVNITFEAEGKIETVTLVQPTTTGSQTVDITKKMGENGTTNSNGETTAKYYFVVSATDLTALFASNAGADLVYNFKLLDQQGKETSKTFTVTLGSTGTPFTKTKTGSFYHISGVNPGAWDLDGDAAVTVNGTASAKSMKNTDAAGVTFTGSWTSDAANQTKYVKVNSYDYANATFESAATAYAAGTASATVTNPAIGDIYIGLKGTATLYVIKITDFDITSKGNLGKITFEYKKN